MERLKKTKAIKFQLVDYVEKINNFNKIKRV